MLKTKTNNNKKETKMKNMFKSLIAGTMVILFATSAMADLNSGRVDNPSVYHHMKTVITQVPYNVEVCTQGHVSGGTASSADVIVGAVIGGAIGNQIGKGKGKDAATILGAILGADIANKNKNGTGGVAHTTCSTQVRYQESYQEVYSHSTISWMINGVRYSADYIHQF